MISMLVMYVVLDPRPQVLRSPEYARARGVAFDMVPRCLNRAGAGAGETENG